MNENNINDIINNEEENVSELTAEFEKLKSMAVGQNIEVAARHQELLDMIEECMMLRGKISEAQKDKLNVEEISRREDLLRVFSDIKKYCIELKGKGRLTDIEVAELRFLREHFIPSINYQSGKEPRMVAKEIKNPKYLEGALAKGFAGLEDKEEIGEKVH